MTFEIGSITDALSAEVELKHPGTGAGLGAFFTLAGPEHPVRRRIAFDRARKMREQLQRLGRVELADPEEEADDAIERLVSSILGWRGLSRGGAALAFSVDAARALLDDPKNSWIRDQLQEALDKRNVFITTSAQG